MKHFLMDKHHRKYPIRRGIVYHPTTDRPIFSIRRNKLYVHPAEYGNTNGKPFGVFCERDLTVRSPDRWNTLLYVFNKTHFVGM